MPENTGFCKPEARLRVLEALIEHARDIGREHARWARRYRIPIPDILTELDVTARVSTYGELGDAVAAVWLLDTYRGGSRGHG